MNKLKEYIAVEYFSGLLKVLACPGDKLPIRVSYSFSFLYQESGVKVFLWPINDNAGITPSINVRWRGEYGVIYQCKLVIKIDTNGYTEFILSPKGLKVVKLTSMLAVDTEVDFAGDVASMEKIYHYLYISNNALNLYTKLLKKDDVIDELENSEVQELKKLTEILSCSIQDKNVNKAKEILSRLSKWDFKLSCI